MYIGYTVGFSEEARWCCFPFTAFVSPSLHLSASPFSSLYRQPSFYSHCSLFLYCWEPSVIYFGRGGAELRECLFPKKKKKKERRKEGKKDTFPHNLHQELNRFWQIILASHYLRNVAANFSPNSHPLFFSPRPQNKRVRNHRINWAKGANLPKCLWSNKWEERRMSVLIYPLFQVPSSLWRPQGWME